MQLLHSSPLTLPEFVSLSLLIQADNLSDGASYLVDPLFLVSPYALVSSIDVTSALQDLHNLVKAARNAHVKPPAPAERVAVELLREDHTCLESLQIFRPRSVAGLALYYRVITAEAAVQKMAPLLLPPGKTAGLANVTGVIMTVGISGSPQMYESSRLSLVMAHRVNDCIGLLSKIGASDPAAVKLLLSTFLLSDAEDRKTNEMADATVLTRLPEPEEEGAEKATRGLLSPIAIISPINMITPIGSAIGATIKPRKASMKGETDAPTEMNLSVVLGVGSAEAARSIAEKLTVLSIAETGVYLRKYETSGQERKQNLDLGGKRSKFRRSKRADAKDPDFDNFDYKGAVKDMTRQKPIVAPTFADFSDSKGGTKIALKKKDTGAFASRRKLGGSGTIEEESMMSGQSRIESQSIKAMDPFSTHTSQKTGGLQFDDETSIQQSLGQDSTASQARVQVNIALNEDLACSYKMSQLSSCSVEGVIQVSGISMWM
jgi:hypothetical protein